jgi:hypothetical protein
MNFSKYSQESKEINQEDRFKYLILKGTYTLGDIKNSKGEG